jgi:hypothetical protein
VIVVHCESPSLAVRHLANGAPAALSEIEAVVLPRWESVGLLHSPFVSSDILSPLEQAMMSGTTRAGMWSRANLCHSIPFAILTDPHAPSITPKNCL